MAVVGEETRSARFQQSNASRSKDAGISQDFELKSEATMVRLVMNALQGLQSSLTTIHNLSEAFRFDPADRTFHGISYLWTHSSSCHAFGKILNSIAFSGSSVYLLHKFVHYHQNPPYSLINQAFAVAVGKVLEGYISGIDTLYASVGLRHSKDMAASGSRGCLTSVVVHSEVTLLEVYLHTKELRTQIQALAYICKLHSSVSSIMDLFDESKLVFCDFPKGGDLLSYLFTQLEFADPVHLGLLKFLFIRSCEPYCRFIRSWIYEAKIDDPYDEFIIKYADDNGQPYCYGDLHFPSATIREEQNGVAVPCFLRRYLIPLLRAGQQLQVLIKLRELCNLSTSDDNYEDVLPSWNGFSSYHPTYASSLTFNNGKIEAMVRARSIFYTNLQKKLENSLTKLEIRYLQVVQYDIAPVFLGTLNNAVSSTFIEGLHSSSINKQAISSIGSLNSDDEFSSNGVDPLESSECSSVISSEEENETELLVENSTLLGREQICKAALSSSSSMSQKPLQHNKLNSTDVLEVPGQLLCRKSNEGKYMVDISASLEAKKQNFSIGGCLENPFLNGREYKDQIKMHPSRHNIKLRNQIMSVLKEDDLRVNSLDAPKSSLIDDTQVWDQLENKIHASALNSQDWKHKYDSNFLSMNPMLTKHVLFPLTSEPEKTCHTESRKLISCFDFSSVDDPFKLCVKKIDISSRPGFGIKLPHLKTNTTASVTNNGSGCNYRQEVCNETEILNDKCELNHVSSSDSKHQFEISADKSGGSSWESMLTGSGCVNRDSAVVVEGHTQSSTAMFEMPLDFIIDKCLLQEIMLQYTYVSKLALKLLKEGFDLQDHLMALRRYHFMEVSDWVDFFITALWHQKWNVTGSENRISGIQGLLKLSIQKSSCESDHNKNRLFAFVKGQSVMPLSASTIGVHSFDFLGLGYKVDWPVSIVLTSAALDLYSQIFSFLIQVKLAVFSLTDAWCLLKDLMHVINRNRNSELNKREFVQINFLMKIRHKVNHFVITLQQYVLSQLSHVSWSKFLHSLKDVVKDMFDFESLHMAYLKESLQICFLSAETQPVATIITNILQCALDFQSCLIQCTSRVAPNQDDSHGLLSNINTSEVLAIKKRFDQGLKELYLCYLKSPKHGNFGLSRFWEYLNNNQYYLF